MRTELFATALAIFLLSLLAIALRYYLKARRAAGDSWEVLFGRLIAIDREKIALIASDLMEGTGDLTPREADTELEPEQIWELMGGMEGMAALESNCEVLIDLAAYVQRWYPEALTVAEQLRLDARAIQWHLERLKGAARAGNLESAFPEYAQRAVATYYRMTQNVLALYEAGDLPGFIALQQAI